MHVDFAKAFEVAKKGMQLDDVERPKVNLESDLSTEHILMNDVRNVIKK